MPVRTKIAEAGKIHKRSELFDSRSLAQLFGCEKADVTPDKLESLAKIAVPLLNTFHQKTAVLWLLGSEPFLGGARPIDVLLLKGPEPVIQALEAIAQGVYA